MKHRDLVDKVRELELRIQKLEDQQRPVGRQEPVRTYTLEGFPQELKAVIEPLDRAYDLPLRQMDIEDDFQG